MWDHKVCKAWDILGVWLKEACDQHHCPAAGARKLGNVGSLLLIGLVVDNAVFLLLSLDTVDTAKELNNEKKRVSAQSLIDIASSQRVLTSSISSSETPLVSLR